MAASWKVLVLVAGGLLLAGCSNTLWPSLTGEDPAAGQRVAASRAMAPSDSAAPAPEIRVASKPSADSVPGLEGLTFVGQKVQAMRGDLSKLQQAVGDLNQRMAQLRADMTDAAQRYHILNAAMNAKLQTGTTPGNPILVQQWKDAERLLEEIDGAIARMNGLSGEAGSEATVAGYLLDSVRATYALSGAVDDDHRNLRLLEDEVNRTVVLIDRLLNELSDDINRQTAYVSNERRNLTTMSLAVRNGELYGSSLMNRAFAQTEALTSVANRSRTPDAGDRPLVVIRFDRPNVSYQQALYNAVSRALERKPNASFSLVAVSPKKGSPAQVALNTTAAKREAEGVLRALADMGLPPSRIALSAATSQVVESNEVQIFVR